MNNTEYTLLSGASMAGNVTSPAARLDTVTASTIQASWTGAPTGTLELQLSNDDITWTFYTGSSSAIAGVAGNFAWNMLSAPFQFARVFYAASGGAGTLKITVSGKGPA